MNKLACVAVEHLSVAFRSAGRYEPAVDDVSFTFRAGEMVALVGESGSGKSLTALSMLQLLPHGAHVGEKSRILYDGQDLLALTPRQIRTIRGAKMGMIFQEASVAFNPVLRIGEQICEVLRCHHELSIKALRERGLGLLKEVGLDDAERCWHAYAHQLSGGMRQRAMIAMALAGEPEFLLADEPTTALDVTLQAQVMDLLAELKAKRGLGVLLITHDLPLVSSYADRVLVMKQGKLVEQAEAKAFFCAPVHPYSQHLLASMPKAKSEAACSKPKPSKLLLKATDLSVHFPICKGVLQRKVANVAAVEQTSLRISPGETLAIVGESGSGKTTLARALLRLEAHHQGEVAFVGHSVTSMGSKALRGYRRQVQMVFQDPYQSLNPRHLVQRIVLEGEDLHGKRLRGQARENKAAQLLDMVGLLPEHQYRYPNAFSGGQRQRIAIARTLALQPRLLICDEPTSALDVSIRRNMLDVLQRIQTEHGVALLLITHDFSVVRYLADRVMVMQAGRVVEQGSAEAVLNSPESDYTRRLLASVPVLAS